ncbi:MAG: hypothetical protein LBE10_07135 [Treponema sp.]|nr:hypothetical protein [Treponema sp.]
MPFGDVSIVVVEILNSTANFDIGRIRVNSWPFFMRNGDIYAGITGKGHVVDSLLRFGKKRYGPINRAKPLPGRHQDLRYRLLHREIF